MRKINLLPVKMIMLALMVGGLAGYARPAEFKSDWPKEESANADGNFNFFDTDYTDYIDFFV